MIWLAFVLNETISERNITRNLEKTKAALGGATDVPS